MSEAVLKAETQHPTGSQPFRRTDPHQELDAFLREHNNALISYVYSWVRSRADAADIVQEVYCRIFRLPELGAVKHLRGYLFKAAKNIATDWVRQRIVRETFAQEEPLRGNLEAASPEHIWLVREELEAFERDVEMLPPKCQFAFLKVKLEGASYEEVATQLGIKIHSARRLVERANECLVEARSQDNLIQKSKRGRPARKVEDCQDNRSSTVDHSVATSLCES
jgi:RNA polymerase sigma-70 factor (ECF subfamily)